MGGDPWAKEREFQLLISLLGPVVDIQAGLAHHDVAVFMHSARRAAGHPDIHADVDRPGFFAALPPVEGSVDALQRIAVNRWPASLVAPADQSRWRSCRSDMCDWVEHHLGIRWADSMIMTSERSMIRGRRLLTSYVEFGDRHDPSWDRVILDAPHNARVAGIRMMGWQDAEGLVGDWFDRIPWVSGANGAEVWNIKDSDHFSITVVRRGETYELDVFVEMFDESTGYSTTIEGMNDLEAAASRPKLAGQILLDPVRTWRVGGSPDTEYVGKIADHARFEWMGRGWG